MNTRAAATVALEKRIGYVFRDRELLERALTHASVGETGRKQSHNQRLEFLGDRVLGLVVSERLFEDHPDSREGELNPKFHALVDKAACARAARRAGLGPALRMGGGAGASGLRDSVNVLGDACEALLAAVFLDGGLDASRLVVAELWGEELLQPLKGYAKRSKTQLSEWANKAKAPHPVYRIVDRSGPDHEPDYTVSVELPDVEPALGKGRSRGEAEEAAAAALLERLST